MLNVLVSTIFTDSFAEKNVSSFSYSHFFSKTITLYAIFNVQSFNYMLTNNIVSFEHLDPPPPPPPPFFF